jgi:hypothetical protein
MFMLSKKVSEWNISILWEVSSRYIFVKCASAALSSTNRILILFFEYMLLHGIKLKKYS